MVREKFLLTYMAGVVTVMAAAVLWRTETLSGYTVMGVVLLVAAGVAVLKSADLGITGNRQK